MPAASRFWNEAELSRRAPRDCSWCWCPDVLPGFAGRLVSEYFLEIELSEAISDSAGSGLKLARAQLARWWRDCEWLGPASTVQTLFEAAAAPLVQTLGFDAPSGIERAHGCAVATIRADREPIVLLVAPWGERLDPLWRTAVSESIRRSAAWSIVFNGTHLRLVDAGRPYARRFVEFDVCLALDDERSLAALWLLLHATTFHSRANQDRPRIRSLVDRSEQHASGVSKSLRDGVLAASADVLGALLRPARKQAASRPLDDSFEQSLTVVYRILFLLFAEARGLVPLWHPVYRDSYSVDSLRAVAERPQPATGLWDTLQAIARLAHAGCRAGDLRVTPFNGRLFAPSRTPLADRRDLDDEAARRAVLALSTRPAPDRAGRERIAYRDLGVEQLGAVYETLLDYEPRIDREPSPSVHSRRPRAASPASFRVALVRGSGVRKATGSFYTPQPLADYLVRRTLGPLVQAAAPGDILRLRVVDPAMGSGAFLVAACRYLADAYETAMIRTGGCAASDFGENERVAARRTIAERCLYGVDVNPMAVQLARLSLWLTTLAADRPLTFLDHHLQSGDSLIGAWLEHLRRAPILRPGRRAAQQSWPLFDGAGVAEALGAALPVRFSLAELPGDTIEQVRTKERALAALNGRHTSLSKWKRVADVWCAPWFGRSDGAVPASVFGALSDAILAGGGALPPSTAHRYLERAAAIAQAHRLFHWELEFPEIFFGSEGERRPDAGFDAVIGNPPWDMLRADAGPDESRACSRMAASALIRFTRDSGAYSAQSEGHANRYQLFLERSIALTRPGGRIGMVLPSGLATDQGSAALRRHLLAQCDVDALVGFDNQHGVFPIHRSVRFLLLTAARGTATRTIACRLGEHQLSSLESIGDEPSGTSAWFTVRVTPALLQRLSGDGLAIPDLRSPVDVTILERAATLFPPLGSRDGWNARFGRELNATDDREHLGPPGRGLPVVEGKQIEPFRADLRAVRFSVAAGQARRLLKPARYGHRRLAYRDVASATNRLTLIAALLPAGCVSTHTVFCLRTPLSTLEQQYLCGLFNSFVLNYFVRLRVTTHVTTAVVERLPVPTRDGRPRAFREVAVLARGLGRRHDEHAFARLQALVAATYELSASEFGHILDTFPLVPRDIREAALLAFTKRTQPGSD
jgi:hypothetical protein